MASNIYLAVQDNRYLGPQLFGVSLSTDRLYHLGMEGRKASAVNGGAVAASALVLYGIWDAAWFAGNPGTHRSWAWPTWWLLVPTAAFALSLLAIAFPIVPHRTSRANGGKERGESHGTSDSPGTGGTAPPSEAAVGVARPADSTGGCDSDDLVDRRNDLVELLANSITGAYIEQIAGEAGLRMAHIQLQGTPSNQWSALIRRAEQDRRERRVVERARRINPNPDLHRAIEEYLRCRP
jgi:hypothetical protein